MQQNVITLKNPPAVLSYASAVGKKESEGPLKDYFDVINTDTSMGQDSWEKAESLFQKTALKTAMKKRGYKDEDIDIIFAGDLLAQCAGSSFGMRGFSIPYAGVYGACSTMALSLILASLSVDGSYAKKAAAITSSHFCSAEKQFRKPLEYGGQRPPSAQWTVTGSCCVILGENEEKAPHIEKVIFGKVRDLGVSDENNMGAAMAPAACETIARFLQGTNTKPSDYDLILTGDLGAVGKKLLYEMLEKEYDIDISKVHNDCGLMIYKLDEQDVNAGGSGCGCSASVLCSKIMKELFDGTIEKMLFVATGALLSQTTTLQGETVPGIAHGVYLTGGRK